MAARRPRRKAAAKCNRRLKSFTDSSYKDLQADIPLINEAYRSDYAPNPKIGDAETGQIVLASLPFADVNGDYKTYTIFANEDDKVYVVKSTNLMADVPAYYEHIKKKQAKYDFVNDAIKAYREIIKEKDNMNVKDKMNAKGNEKLKKKIAKGVQEKVCCYVFIFV